MVSNYSITLGGEGKVPEEGDLSGGRSMITRNDGKILRSTGRSFSNEENGKVAITWSHEPICYCTYMSKITELTTQSLHAVCPYIVII